MYKIIGGDQNEYGPVSADEIRQWIAEGRANANTLVQLVGDPNWRPLASFPEFAAAVGAVPPGAAPPGAVPPGAPPPFPTGAPGPASAAPPLTPAEILARDYDLDIGDCILRAWELLKANFLPIIGVSFLISVILSAVNQAISLIYRVPMDAMIKEHEFSAGGVALILSGMLLGMPIQSILMGGLYNFYLKMIRREKCGVEDAFAGFTRAPGRLALLGVLMGILMILGLALCIIPGLYLSVAWVFATPLVIDKELSAWEAMELSRKMVSRHWFMVFALMIVAGLLGACGFLACCVGILVTIPLSWVAMMYAYEDIFNRRAP